MFANRRRSRAHSHRHAQAMTACMDMPVAFIIGFCNTHMGHFPQDGENEQNVSFFSFFLKLHCDQTV